MTLGLLLGLGASVSWAMANVAIQRSGRELGPFRALFWAQLSVLPPFALSSLLWEAHEPLDTSLILWALIAGASSLCAYVPLFYALEKGRLSVVVPIASSWTIVSTAMAVPSGEPLRANQVAGTVLVLAGIVLVTRPPSSRLSVPRDTRAERRATLAAFVAAVGFGVMVPAL